MSLLLIICSIGLVNSCRPNALVIQEKVNSSCAEWDAAKLSFESAISSVPASWKDLANSLVSSVNSAYAKRCTTATSDGTSEALSTTSRPEPIENICDWDDIECPEAIFSWDNTVEACKDALNSYKEAIAALKLSLAGVNDQEFLAADLDGPIISATLEFLAKLQKTAKVAKSTRFIIGREIECLVPSMKNLQMKSACYAQLTTRMQTTGADSEQLNDVYNQFTFTQETLDEMQVRHRHRRNQHDKMMQLGRLLQRTSDFVEENVGSGRILTTQVDFLVVVDDLKVVTPLRQVVTFLKTLTGESMSWADWLNDGELSTIQERLRSLRQMSESSN